MLNLIRMNLYRLIKTKNLYILLLCSGLLCLLLCYMDRIDYLETQKEEKTVTETTQEEETTTGITIEKIDQVDPEESNFGIAVHTPDKTDGKNPVFLEYVHSYLASGILLIFLIIGSALYVNGESKCGFIKNIAGQTRHKSYIYIAKIIAMAVYTAFFMLFFELVHYIGLNLFLPYHIPFGKEYLFQSTKLMATTFLLYTAFISAVALLVTLTRSTSVGITVGMLASFGFLSLVTPYLEKLFHVKIQKYMIITNMQQLLLNASNQSIRQCIFVGGIFLLIYLLCGTVYFTKKDVV